VTSAPFIRSGRLNRRAELQSRTLTADGGGGSAVTWTKERDIWVGIRELSGTERLQAMREQSAITHEIWARYATDVTADKRIVSNSVNYNLRAVMDPENAHEFLRILAESGVAT
jgi:SPP1 family predicted phage head-tail adaptor